MQSACVICVSLQYIFFILLVTSWSVRLFLQIVSLQIVSFALMLRKSEKLEDFKNLLLRKKELLLIAIVYKIKSKFRICYSISQRSNCNYMKIYSVETSSHSCNFHKSLYELYIILQAFIWLSIYKSFANMQKIYGINYDENFEELHLS